MGLFPDGPTHRSQADADVETASASTESQGRCGTTVTTIPIGTGMHAQLGGSGELACATDRPTAMARYSASGPVHAIDGPRSTGCSTVGSVPSPGSTNHCGFGGLW